MLNLMQTWLNLLFSASYAETLEGLNGTIAHLDVINRQVYSTLRGTTQQLIDLLRFRCSFAHVANHAPIAYVKPKVIGKGQGDLILKDSRHPCLETLPDISFIPNDVCMVREKSEFQIITGANTGGKSVYLRQVRLLTLAISKDPNVSLCALDRLHCPSGSSRVLRTCFGSSAAHL